MARSGIGQFRVCCILSVYIGCFFFMGAFESALMVIVILIANYIAPERLVRGATDIGRWNHDPAEQSSGACGKETQRDAHVAGWLAAYSRRMGRPRQN